MGRRLGALFGIATVADPEHPIRRSPIAATSGLATTVFSEVGSRERPLVPCAGVERMLLINGRPSESCHSSAPSSPSGSAVSVLIRWPGNGRSMPVCDSGGLWMIGPTVRPGGS